MAGLATVALTMALTARTGDQEKKDKPEAKETLPTAVAKACDGSTFTWSNKDGASSISVDTAGEYVEYAYVQEVEGDFWCSCPGGEATVGHTKSWKIQVRGGVSCDEDPGSDAGRQAALLSCDENSVAAKSEAKATAGS